MPDSKSSAALPRSDWRPLAAVAVALAALGAVAVLLCARLGYTLYYGDAEAHLNIARRILDSRTPGGEQFGTVWLPLPHLLMIPFVTWTADAASDNAMWRSGLGGVIPTAACFVLAGA